MQMIHVALLGMGASTPVVAAAKAPRCYGFVVLVFSWDQNADLWCWWSPLSRKWGGSQLDVGNAVDLSKAMARQDGSAVK